MNQDILRTLPSVDEVLRQPWMQDVIRGAGRSLAVRAVQTLIARHRAALLAQGSSQPDPAGIAAGLDRAAVMAAVDQLSAASLRPLINATGIIVHTNLGRAPLCAAALEAVVRTARGYCNLEFDIEQGARGHRSAHIAECMRQLCGAEAAFAVNNNAAAVLLCLSALAHGRDVIVSRGELVEIGGSFRIPDIMQQSGARLIEVGTTNRTHVRDYRRAISENRGLIFKAHTSNYRIVGFTAGVTLQELVALGREQGVPVVYDMGSGCINGAGIDALRDEPTVQDALAAGVDLVMFSADKLLGGPQAGLIAGRRDLVAALENHPLARALRLDKMTLAALEQTLRMYVYTPERLEELPVVRMLRAAPEDVRRRARSFVRRLKAALPGCTAQAVPDVSQVGGGACPLRELPTWVVELDPGDMGAPELERRLRRGEPPVAARIKNDRILLDLRTVSAGETGLLVQAVQAALAS
jgi:L-seryl-tRNA(Ser) seleniumtransferase